MSNHVEVHKISAYQIVFPATYVIADTSNVTIEDYEKLMRTGRKFNGSPFVKQNEELPYYRKFNKSKF